MRQDGAVREENVVDGDDRHIEEVATEKVGDRHVERADAQRGHGDNEFGQRGRAPTNKVPTKLVCQPIAAARSPATKGSQVPAPTITTAPAA